jgi:hypothetical protein
MAKATVDMERGVYPWPDGRKPFRQDGTPIVVKAEICRAAGYNGDSNQRNQEKWFNDPFYLQQVALERARRDVNLQQIMAAEENLPLAIAKGLYELAIRRILTDPEAVSVSEAIAIATPLHKYGLELLAAEEEQLRRPRIDAGEFTDGTLYDMTDEQREQALALVKDQAAGRVRLLESAVAKARVIEEHAHAGSDELPGEDTAVNS